MTHRDPFRDSLRSSQLNWVNSQHLKAMPVDDVAVLVKEQLLMEVRSGIVSLHLMNNSNHCSLRSPQGITREDAKGTDSEERIATAATCLAKQMMATTKDAAHNARDVLEYKLPNAFDDLEGEVSLLKEKGG